MAMTMQVDIVSAEENVFSGTAQYLSARAANGEVGILPRHAPMLLQLQPGEVRVTNEAGEQEMYYVSGGVLEVQPHIVTILSDTAVRAADLDEAAAAEAKRRAEEALKDQKTDIDFAKTQAELLEAIAQLRTIRRLREQIR